ncbi:hypothetical protein F4777DRAFT_217527 [Nemania sp. FL0916]|nr:hypothetical protein F4777DRAFT_217527 [Nemania sp. FL0916]
MPPRIPLIPALRRGLSLAKSSPAPLSTTAAAQAVQPRSRDSAASILSIDRNPNPNPNSYANPNTTGSGDLNLKDMYRQVRMPQRRPSTGEQQNQRQAVEGELRQGQTQADYLRQMPRRWRAGDVYAPHDLSPSEMTKWRKATIPQQDAVDFLGIRPLDMYRNFSMISEFITPHGRIKRAKETGLRPVNQRKMAKAIRRAIGLGLHPSVHKHPEILKLEPDRMRALTTSGTVNTSSFGSTVQY